MLDDFKPVKRTRKVVRRLPEQHYESSEPKELNFKTPDQMAGTEMPEEPKELTFDETKKPSRFKALLKKKFTIFQWGTGFLVITALIAGGDAYETMKNRQPTPDTTI